MKKLLVITLSSLLFANLAWAEGTACESKAAEKKLAGAAKNSFMKKCEREAKEVAVNPAQEKCEGQAAEKKLRGAAKNSFVKKCTADASK